MKPLFFALCVTCFMISQACAAPTQRSLDTEKSSLNWKGSKVTGFHEGTLALSKGIVTFEGAKLVGGIFELNMGSITNTDLSGKYKTKLENHLKSDDFFNISQYPLGTFEITSVMPKSITDGSGTYEITGLLDVKGIKKEVSFPATVKRDGDVYAAHAKIILDRTNWDIRYNSGKFFDPANLGDKLIYDDIEISLNLVTTAS